MIGWLQGDILEKQENGKILMNVQNVGYEIETSLNTCFKINLENKVALFIHTVVREDAFLLYGFIDQAERKLFRNLIKVNGIGPKVAIGILSSVSVSEFFEAIQSKDAKRLQKMPGIGKKTAERLLIEMFDIIINIDTSQVLSSNNTEQSSAIEALVSLGYKPQLAKNTVMKFRENNLSCEEIIRLSLQKLAR